MLEFGVPVLDNESTYDEAEELETVSVVPLRAKPGTSVEEGGEL